MDFDAKGIKWKLKICSLDWNPICVKNYIPNTLKVAAKRVSLHIYAFRAIVHHCRSRCNHRTFSWPYYPVCTGHFFVDSISKDFRTQWKIWKKRSQAKQPPNILAQYFCKRSRSRFRSNKIDPELGSFLTGWSC